MKRLLLDTHAVLWFIGSPAKLRPSTRSLIEAINTEPLVSIASLWEISVKVCLGKLSVMGGFTNMPTYLSVNKIEILPLSFDHTLENSRLPFHHRDPFDRIIAAQAISEQIDLVSVDTIFDSYFAQTNSRRIW